MKKYALIASLLLFSVVVVGCTHKPLTASDAETGAVAQNEGKPMGKHAADSDETFIVGMIPHHQEAVDTATYIVENSTNDEVKAFAQKIIDTQKAEITTMQGWLNEWYPKDALQPIFEPMMPTLTSLEGNELDRTFLVGMITHHQAAVQMANDVLMLEKRRPEVEAFAENIKEVQNAEIAEMETLLKNLP
ncbi:DUF305 domain-containing protein [Patescibacteria group bacterium]|nr:DUF305 domain-containing protein [Patescibacteria group bacterium]